VSQLQGTIVKKCDMAGHKPDSNKWCAAGTCQHTCDDIVRCAQVDAALLRERGAVGQVVRWQDQPGTGRTDYGSGMKLARDFQLKLTHDKRAEGAGYGLRDNRPGIPEVLHPHGLCVAHADVVAAHQTDANQDWQSHG